MLELLLNLIASISLEWRLWKWIHDPPLKGDRLRQPDAKEPNYPNKRQPPNTWLQPFDRFERPLKAVSKTSNTERRNYERV
jgi:hypothetical protein